jgi:hypothetical protein
LGVTRYEELGFVIIPLHSLVGEERLDNQSQSLPLTKSTKGIVEGAVLHAKIFVKLKDTPEVCAFIFD